jgi:hypothetical protein
VVGQTSEKTAPAATVSQRAAPAELAIQLSNRPHGSFNRPARDAKVPCDTLDGVSVNDHFDDRLMPLAWQALDERFEIDPRHDDVLDGQIR